VRLVKEIALMMGMPRYIGKIGLEVSTGRKDSFKNSIAVIRFFAIRRLARHYLN
jgi:hypothetical protein